jgi:hypothetical protein
MPGERILRDCIHWSRLAASLGLTLTIGCGEAVYAATVEPSDGISHTVTVREEVNEEMAVTPLKAVVSQFGSSGALLSRLILERSQQAIRMEPANIGPSNPFIRIEDFGQGVAYLVHPGTRQFVVADLITVAPGTQIDGYVSSVFPQRNNAATDYRGGLLSPIVCAGLSNVRTVPPSWYSTRDETWHECRGKAGNVLSREFFSQHLGMVVKVEFPDGTSVVAEPVDLAQPALERFRPPDDYTEVPIEVVLESLPPNMEVIL